MMAGDVDLEHLETARFYLFGNVQYLDLLLLLMAIDIVTGIFKAFKNQNLWSRKSLFGYSRKVLVLTVIILANVIDQILNLDGVVAYATVFFYIANEGLSILENLSAVGVLVPPKIAEKLKIIESDSQSFNNEIGEELLGTKVEKELEDDKQAKERD